METDSDQSAQAVEHGDLTHHPTAMLICAAHLRCVILSAAVVCALPVHGVAVEDLMVHLSRVG